MKLSAIAARGGDLKTVTRSEQLDALGSVLGYVSKQWYETEYGVHGAGDWYRRSMVWLEDLYAAIAKPVRSLRCNCCGGDTRGRQWRNRDTGYGMCLDCITFVRKRGMPETEIRDLYGFEGIHWGVNE